MGQISASMVVVELRPCVTSAISIRLVWWQKVDILNIVLDDAKHQDCLKCSLISFLCK